jgi:hypothetical protein
MTLARRFNAGIRPNRQTLVALAMAEQWRISIVADATKNIRNAWSPGFEKPG